MRPGLTKPSSAPLTALPEAAPAAHNNALWCDALCKAHGGDTQWGQGWWRNRRPSPPLYPNLVTLAPGALEAQLVAVRGLLAEGLPGEFGVKDSFGALDLRPLGFRVLFEAAWVGRPASGADFPGGGAALPVGDMRRVTTETELAAWEAGWRGGEAGPRLFLPALLKDPEIAFLGVFDEGRVAAGLAAHRSNAVVGVSNLFWPAEGGEGLRAPLLSAAQQVFPGLPLVGYEHGADLAAMRALGFEALGGLRVWAAPQPGAAAR
jgi:hypothetical protein